MVEIDIGENFKLNLEVLKKHFIALGGSGSGKTVLCKAIIEEASSLGIPCLLVDTQGDLSSLALGKLNVVVFTPCSSKGISISLNPLKLPKQNLDDEDLITVLNQMSNSFVQLLGYKVDTDKAKIAQSAIYLLLRDCVDNNRSISDLNEFAELIENADSAIRHEIEITDDELKTIAKKIRLLTLGGRELLFQMGMPLDINVLLRKNRVSVIYLNSIKSHQEKYFFISTLCTQLYQWMLDNPKDRLQSLFYIDEIAEFIPAGQKTPVTKDILKLIFKQARKYGVGCIVSTQNPGDIDYKAFAQFSTWAMGRLTAKQDIKKIENVLKGKSLELKLPRLQPGEFLIFSPDVSKKIEFVKVRRLHTEHKTLRLEDVKEVVSEKARNEFSYHMPARIERMKKITSQEFFDLNINEEAIRSIIEKQKKKRILFFGTNEHLESSSLVYRPIFETKVRQIIPGLFKKRVLDSLLMFDGITGALITCAVDSIIINHDFVQLLDLEQNEVSLLKILIEHKKELTSAELSASLKMTDSYVSKVLNNLMKKKVVSTAGKSGRSYLWQPLIRMKLKDNLRKVSSNVHLTTDKTDSKTLKPKISLSKISKVIKAWFNADILEDSVVFYPVYEVKFASDKSRRIVYISGVNGKVVGF